MSVQPHEPRVFLEEQWKLAVAAARGPEDRAAAGAAFAAVLGRFPAAVQRDFVGTVLGQQIEFLRALDSARSIISELEVQVTALTRPPRPTARLRRLDELRGTALVALDPATMIEVEVPAEVEEDGGLAPGVDVALTPERNAIAAVIGKPDAGFGGTRLLPLRRLRPGAAEDGTVQAVAGERGEDRVVTVPAALSERLKALAEGASGPVQLLVDRFDQVLDAEAAGEGPPLLAAARFRIELPRIAPEAIVGLRAQREMVERACRRALIEGAILLAQGPPGTGKTLLARLACYLLAQGGETVVLGLPPVHDHRYFRQEEADIAALCAAAQALAKEGRRVLIFLDEIDRHFFRPLHGLVSVHDNSARATWLAQLGGEMDLRGILVYATTNKAAALPDELLNRVHFLLTFDRISPETARAVLDLALARDAASGAVREAILDAVVDRVYDTSAAGVVATAVLRDRSLLPVRRRDLRQVSARFFNELARRLDEAAAARNGGRPSGLTVEEALACLDRRFEELVSGVRLAPENLGERTFHELSPRNPVEEVLAALPASSSALCFRYTPLEVSHEPA